MIDVVGRGAMASLYQDILVGDEDLLKSSSRDSIVAIPFHLHEKHLSSSQSNRILIEKPVITSEEGMTILIDKCVYGGHVLRFFDIIEFVRIFLQETNAIVQEIDIKRYSNKEKKKWWYECSNFLFWYEVIHSIDIIDYLLSLNKFEWKEKCLKNSNGLLVAVKSSFVVNGVNGRISHNMESNEKINTFILKTSIGNIEIVDYEKVYIKGKLELNSTFSEEMDKALKKQVRSFIFESPELEKISFKKLKPVYRTMLAF